MSYNWEWTLTCLMSNIEERAGLTDADRRLLTRLNDQINDEILDKSNEAYTQGETDAKYKWPDT